MANGLVNCLARNTTRGPHTRRISPWEFNTSYPTPAALKWKVKGVPKVDVKVVVVVVTVVVGMERQLHADDRSAPAV
jgi:hypothetical protein